MGKFDRYLLSQLMVFFGFFSLVLVMVYWVNQAVSLFDKLIADGQSATVFLEFTALTLPNVIRIVLPISAFVASIYATNRMSSESELVVVQAMGFSGFRLARPVLVFGLIVALIAGIMTNILVPLSSGMLAERSAALRENITARFLTEGSFLHPTDGITFYIREISPQGELLDVFMSDTRKPNAQVTYTAKNSHLVRHETGPKLVMLDGLAQTLNSETQNLFTTGFSDFTFDLGPLIKIGNIGKRSANQVPTLELLRANPALQKETRQSRAALRYQAHKRFAQPLLAVVTALIGFSTLLIGNFSRFGVMRQIIGAIVLLVIIKALDSAVIGIARSDESMTLIVYLPVVVGLALSAAMLWLSERPGLFSRIFKRKGVTA